MYIYSLYPYQSEFLPFSLSFTIETSSDKAESFLINFYGPFFRDFSSITIGTQAHTIISIIVDLLNHSFEKQYSKLWENFNFDDGWTLSKICQKIETSFIRAQRLKFRFLKIVLIVNIHRLYAIKIYSCFIRYVSGSCFPPRSALNSPLFFAVYLEELEAFRIHCQSSIITDLSTGLYFRESAIRNSFFRKKSPRLFSPLFSLIFQLACCISWYIIEK